MSDTPDDPNRPPDAEDGGSPENGAGTGDAQPPVAEDAAGTGASAEESGAPPPPSPPLSHPEPPQTGSAPPAYPGSPGGASTGGAPPQGQPAYAYPPGPPPARTGAGIGAGVGIGCGAYAVGLLLVFLTLGAVGNIFGFIWPFILIVLAAIAMMLSPRSRPIATGILIVSAAAWILVLGPCIVLVSGIG